MYNTELENKAKKVIYLDQNKWIELAKAIIKPEENKKYADVADLISNKVERGDWIFPISSMHVFETTLRANANSREKLVDVMVKISNGYAIKSFLDIQGNELSNTFFKIISPEKVSPIEAVLKNPLIAIGAEKFNIDIENIYLPNEIKQELINIVEPFFKKNIKDDDIAKTILNNYDNSLADDFIKNDKLMTKIFNEDRISLLKLNKEDRYVIFLTKIFTRAAQDWNRESLKLFIDNEKIKSIFSNKDQAIDFLEDSPSLNIYIKLLYELLKDKERPIKEHDHRDINFLSTAVPYCDIVITEKTWKHLINLNKLDKKYSTTVENDLNYLLNI